MSVRIAGFCLALAAASAPALERNDSRGLQVQVEPVGNSIRVDTLPIRIVRAEGRDVPQLARRIEQRWRREGGEVRPLAQPGWAALSRWRNGQSELIQWRDLGATAELLYSMVDVVATTRPRGREPLLLPARCAWGRQIEGRTLERDFTQRSAYCRMEAEALYDALLAALRAQGWIVRHATRLALDVEREGVEGVLLLNAAGAGSAVTWLGLRRVLNGPRR